MSDETTEKQKPESWLSRLQKNLHPKKVLRNENFIHALPFIFFLSFIAMVYIANSYYAEKTIREIDKTNNELKELRSEYISTKSDLMLISKQSEVAKAVISMQIKESIVPPKKIIVRNGNIV